MHRKIQTALLFALPIIGMTTSVLAIWFTHSERLSMVNFILLQMVIIIINIVLIVLYFKSMRNHHRVEQHATQFERQAYTDAMTQVMNRAAFDLKIAEMDPARYPNLTLFMLDLNNLKETNDTLGHLTGDQLICALVTCIKDAFGPIGQIYRYGGDEFIVLIEDAPIDQVRASQVRFDQLIAQHDSDNEFDIFVAVGMASRQQPEYTGLHAGELLHAADEVMYRYKTRQKTLANELQLSRRLPADQIDPVTGVLTFFAFQMQVRRTLAENNVLYPCIVNFDLNFYNESYSRLDQATREFLLQELTSLARRLRAEQGFCGHGEADSFWVFVDAPNLDTLKSKITAEALAMQNRLNAVQMSPKFGIYPIRNVGISVFDMCNCAIFAKKGIYGQADSLYNIYMEQM